MFAFKHGHSEHADLSSDLMDERDFSPSHLKTLEYLQDIRVLTFEPLSGLLAVGTSSGTVWIFGAPGVQECIKVADQPLKFVEFASSVSKLLCVDETNRLYIWDLSQPRHPLRQASTKLYETINYVTLSPAHTHAFLVLQSGTVKTYDLLNTRTSPYVIPNMWLEYEKKLATTHTCPMEPGFEIPVSLTIHPRDLNLIFVCYGGAVVLANLNDRSTLKVYEYILPAGAPGPSGYFAPDLMKHRHPGVTSFAIHPAGHFFAVGYTDGSIAFWALEDENQPLLVQTLEEVDVNVVDGDMLSKILGEDEGDAGVQKTESQTLEPIFKLSWSAYPNSSDPRGGATTLTVLGAFNPTEPPDCKRDLTLSPFMRAAMRESVLHSDRHIYTASGIVHDYLLLPRESPHFSGCFDPIAIIILSDDTITGSRSTDCYEFPPPIFELKRIPQDKAAPASPSSDDDCLSQDLASTLESMRITDEPNRFGLPTTLWRGSSSVLGGDIIKLEEAPYKALLRSCEQDKVQGEDYGLRGGVSWVDDTDNATRHVQFQPHRILITRHRDLTIHFQDISVQLLLSSESSPASRTFPCPLQALTIDLVVALSDPTVLPRCSPEALQEGSIDSVYICAESLECAIIFKTGEVFVYKFEAEPLPPSEDQDMELLSLVHIPSSPGRHYRPFLMISSERGPVAAFASSDIGFLAISYNDGSLFIIDLRGPRVILRESHSQSRNRHSFLKHSNDHVDPVKSLTWGIFKLESDKTSHVRLIAIRISGHTTLYTLTRESTSGTFLVTVHPNPLEAVADPLQASSFVLEAKTGARCAADRTRFASSLGNVPLEKERDVFWISAGSKGIKSVLNVDGERIARTDWCSKVGHVETVQIVQRHNACVLTAFTNKKEMLVYSVPRLELMHTSSIPRFSTGSLSLDDTGDYVEWVHGHGSVVQGHLGTLFNAHRQSLYKNQVTNLMVGKKGLPSQPHPVSMGPTSVLSKVFSYVSGQFTTGEQIDALLGGPDRPVPEKQTATEWLGVPNSSADLQAATSGVGDMYNRLGAAIVERGQMLDGLEESVNSLQKGSKDMLAQAKKLAQEQSAKGWFNFHHG